MIDIGVELLSIYKYFGWIIFQFGIDSDEDVLGFDVPMEQIVAVQMIQASDHLIEEILHSHLGQASLAILDIVIHVHIEQLRNQVQCLTLNVAGWG